MTTTRALKISIEPPMLGNGDNKMRVLWRVRINIDGIERTGLFRAGEDFANAATVLQEIIETSPAMKMHGSAQVMGIDRIARLWN